MSDTNEMFTVKLRGVPMQISRSQIQADSPGGNFFAASLLGDFSEASDRTLTLDRHPAIFRLILDHLSGYRIFPLDKLILKSHHGDALSVERALRYIQDDAEYFGLSRLHALASEEIERVGNQAESYQDQVITLKRYKLELERTRLELDVDVANAKSRQSLYDERLKILQTYINAAGKKLQAAATVAAPRQVGSAGYGRDERQRLSELISRLSAFKGRDILNPRLNEDENWIQLDPIPNPFHYQIPALPAQSRNSPDADERQ